MPNARRVYTPTRAELRAVSRGRTAIRRGDFVTVDDLRTSLAAAGKHARPKKRPARARA